MDEERVPEPADDEKKAAEEHIERLVPLAKDIVLVLVKTLKATGIYLPNNPIYKRFHEELAEKFAAYFAVEERLSLRINRFELSFLDREVYQNPDKEANVALMFFKDGVREVCFHNGIDEKEIKDFIDILKFDAKEQGLDDDLVTLMWEKDFRNITYTVTEDVTADESEEEEALLSFDEEPEEIRQIEALRAMAKKEASEARPDAAPSAASAWSGAPAAPSAGFTGFEAARSAAGGPDEDGYYESIRGTYEAPDDIALLTELTDIFYEILVTEDDMEKFGVVTDSLTKALDIFVSRGDLALATILVMKVQELAGSGRLTQGEALTLLDRVIQRAGSATLVEKVGQFIEETGQAGALEAAGSYLSQLDERAAGPLAGLLETLSDRKARKTLCAIIPTVVRGSGKTLVAHLRHRYWFVARNIALILGKMADPEVVKPLGAALKHEEPRVRKEVVVALKAIGGPDAVRYVESALEDDNRLNRGIAARALAELDPARTYAKLMEVAGRKDFRDREFDEKREILELLGRTGGRAAMPFLSGIFTQRGFFGKARRDAHRACAAYGLAAVGGEEVLEMLRSEAGSKSRELRAACAEGIRILEKRRG